MKKRQLLASVSTGIFFGCAVAFSGSIANAAGLIQDIAVVGAQRVDPETVKSYLTLQKGDEFDSRRVNRSLKKLFATGLFADVSLKKEGSTLVINVVENPIINRVAFEGNQTIDDDLLASEVSLRSRAIYTRNRVQNDVERILVIYRLNGRFAATVEPKVIQLDQNRVDLVYEIKEGDKTGVSKIRFVGNKEYSDGALSDVIRTRETRWYNFFTSEDSYDPDRLNYDKEVLRRFYTSRGFADVKITSAVAELSPSREEFFITYTLDEGIRYEVSEVAFENDLPGFDINTIVEMPKIEQGDWYDAGAIDDTINDLVDEIGFQGFPFVKITPTIKRDKENRTIKVTYNIEEGPRVFVERININGNVRTLDEVVRREFRLVEGDALNLAKLKRSKQRINNLAFFKKVDIAQKQGSAPDQKILEVTVEEQSTGTLSVGAGFSTENGPTAEFGIGENNLLGKGQKLSFKGSLSADDSRFDIRFTEPYFLDRELAAGFDLYNQQRDLQDSSSYDLKTRGIVLRTSYPVTENLHQSFSYRFDSTTIENVKSDASQTIKDQAGNEITSSINHAISYDRRDSASVPTEGYMLRLSNEIAGLGGDASYFKNSLTGSYYYPVDDKIVLKTSGRIAYALGLAEDVNIGDRYFLGGDSLRGFKDRGVGPRDRKSDDSLGGEFLYNGSVELRFPLGLPSEYQISGVTFTDFGSLSGVTPKTSDVQDDTTIRLSSGVGLSWVSPMGPISMTWAHPFAKEKYDDEEAFRFSFGTRF